MVKMTSAYANKVIRKLNEDKGFWRRKESESCMYVAALDEEPVIPDYDYSAVASNIQEIDDKIVKIKHAVNVANLTSEVEVGDHKMTVDQILVKMAQLNQRKAVLDDLRKQEPKIRISSVTYSARRIVPEYRYINYDLEVIKKDYERIDKELAEMQIALDKYNQTYEFEVDL
ncbi:MAG: hypothetical protein ACI4DW_04470 [Lachnospiraceae bacterium]